MRVKNKQSGKFESSISDEGYKKIDQLFSGGMGTNGVTGYIAKEYNYSFTYAYKIALKRHKRFQLSGKLHIKQT